MKCNKCQDQIPKGQEAYFKGKVVCQSCFKKLRICKGEKRETIIQAYKRWLAKK